MKIKKILVSQPKPESEKSPYFDIAGKYNVKIDFRPFIKVEPILAKEFRQQHVNIADYNAIVFTSRHGIDHFFRLAEEMRIKIAPELQYFCVSEKIAHYLQKYIDYRKRKVHYGTTNRICDLAPVIQKHKELNYLAVLSADYNDEIGELCGTLNEMSAELSRVEKTQNDFISSVSHELRTPLTAIAGWADTIESCLDDPKLATQGLAIIKKETRRLSQMVEELLDFSRIEGGGMRLQTEPFDLRGDLYDAVFTYTDMLQQEGMKIEYEEPDEPIMVFADKNRLKQVFLNIIDNAGKYGKDGDRVRVTARTEGGSAIVEIRDFGQGIPEKELPFVKQKFYKGSAKGRGAGIGLSVCSDIVQMHGGTLDIDSVYGQGTNVRITLPLFATAK